MIFRGGHSRFAIPYLPLSDCIQTLRLPPALLQPSQSSICATIALIKAPITSCSAVCSSLRPTTRFPLSSLLSCSSSAYCSTALKRLGSRSTSHPPSSPLSPTSTCKPSSTCSSPPSAIRASCLATWIRTRPACWPTRHSNRVVTLSWIRKMHWLSPCSAC